MRETIVAHLEFLLLVLAIAAASVGVTVLVESLPALIGALTDPHHEAKVVLLGAGG